MSVDSLAMCFVVSPLTLIDVAVGVDQSSNAVRLVFVPLTFVQRAIWPHLLANACSEL